MLRLLLPTAKKELHAEYGCRWGIVFLSSLTIIVLAWGFSLLPTYVSLQSEESVLTENLRVATDTTINKDRDQLKQELQVVSKQLQLLNVPEYKISALLQQITGTQTDTVALSSISFVSELSAIDQSLRGTVVLTGVAERRSDLITYTNLLKQKTELFSSVDLPFASLVKDSDIPFTVTLTLTPVMPTNK
jgi:hypothetical protein